MPSRRTLLRALGTGAVPFAGCGGASNTPTRTATRTPTTSPTSSPTATDSPTETPRETPRDVVCETAWAAEPVWSTDRRAYPYEPTPAGEHLLVGSDSGLFSFDPATGRVRWRRDRTGHVDGVADGAAVVNEGNRVVAVAVDDGEPLWTFEPPGAAGVAGETTPVHDGTVYVPASNAPSPQRDVENPYGRLYGFDLQTGDRRFVRDVTPVGREWLKLYDAVAGDAGVFLGPLNGGLLGCDHDGRVRWRRTEDDWGYEPALSGDTVLQPTSRTLVAVRAGSGETRWQDDDPEMHVATAGGVAYGAGGGGPDTDGVFVALDVTTGRHHWETTVAGCGGQPTVGAGVVALPADCRDRPTRLTLLDADRGCRYGHLQPNRGELAGAAIADGRLYTVSWHESTTTVRAFDLP